MVEDPTSDVTVFGATALQAVKADVLAEEPELLPPPAQPVIKPAKASTTR